MKDGGPAFPQESRSVIFEKGHEQCARSVLSGIHVGMTMRDWFAGQALVGIISSLDKFVSVESVAAAAYAQADAMLAEREKHEHP